jgi:hypothetical protein
MTMHPTLKRQASLGAALAAAALCSGCAVTSVPSKDEYRAIFTQVVRKSFDESKVNNVCLPPLFGLGPLGPEAIEINLENDFRTLQSPLGRASQMKALESVGLVVGVESERMLNNKPQKVVTYRRTDKGATYFSGGTFCYARAELDSIVKWKGPVVLGEYRVAWVYYTTRTTALADWAQTPAVLAAFPTVAAMVKGDAPKTRQIAIDLSSEGWDVAEYSKFLQMQ